MKSFILLLLTGVLSFFTIASLSAVHAAVSFDGGYYTNLCGSGVNAAGDTCNGGCDPAQGSCTSPQPYVVKYICDGQQTTCRNNASHFETTQSVTGATCGTTVEVDVYKKSCQTLFGWFCNDSDRTDFMTWYAGDCNGTTTTQIQAYATPTPAPSYSSCTSLTVTSGNNSTEPATVSFNAQGSDTAGPIGDYLYYFGDGQQQETANNQVSHQYQSSGTFSARAFVKDASGNWKTASACETKVTVAGSSLETQKSACSNLFIVSGNYTQAPSQVSFEVTGFDNKGAVRGYRVDPGSGQLQESSTGTFTISYPTAGTYTIKGYVLDSQNNWIGGTGTCARTLYVTTQPLTRQPGTGTPTIFTIVAILGGAVGFSFLLVSKMQTERTRAIPARGGSAFGGKRKRKSRRA